MTRFVVDSWAWIEYFKASSKGFKAKNIIENDQNEIFVPSVVISEVISSTRRQNMNHIEAAKVILALSSIVDVTKEELVDIGILHAEMREKIKDFGLGDSFVLFSARKINAKILTGDPHFKNMKEAIMI